MLSTSSRTASPLLRAGASAVLRDGTGCVLDVTWGILTRLAATVQPRQGAASVPRRLRPCAGLASHHGTCTGVGSQSRGLAFCRWQPTLLVVREGKLTASNYPGPLVMTLCPLQFPWDTVPLLPSSPGLPSTRLASQNCFFSAQRKSGLRLC